MKTQQAEQGLGGDWTFYLWFIRHAVPHWSWIGIPAVCLVIWRAIRFRDRRALLLVIWISVPLLFFSLVPTKVPWYIVPIEPAFALAVAMMLRAAVPQHWILETFFLATLVVLIGLWNTHVLKPVDLSPDVKALGDCVARITPADEQIAFYDPANDYVRPSVLVYANRPMIGLYNPGDLDEWVKQGGRFVWSEQSVDGQIPASFVLIAQVGKQQYLRHGDGSAFPANCSF